MKRKYWLTSVAICATALGILVMFGLGRVVLRDVIKAEVVAQGHHFPLSYSDCLRVVRMLDGKWMSEDNLACGTSDAYFVLTRESGITATFYATFDKCPYVYYAERGRYVRLSQEESDSFRALLGCEQ